MAHNWKERQCVDPPRSSNPAPVARTRPSVALRASVPSRLPKRRSDRCRQLHQARHAQEAVREDQGGLQGWQGRAVVREEGANAGARVQGQRWGLQGLMAKKPSQRSLDRWTKQKWRTKSGKPSTQGPNATGERYLPEKAIKALSDEEYAATTRAKRRGARKGKQHVAQPKRVARKTARHRRD